MAAYDISSATFNQIALDVSGQDTNPLSMMFNNDGTKLYVLGSDANDINEYTLTTAYDISSATFDSIALDVSGQESSPTAIMYNDDGTVLYVLGHSGDDINEYALSTAYDVSSATFTQSALYVGAQESNPYDMMFNNDGTVLYVAGYYGDDINEYTLTTPYDISTGTFNQIALDVSSQESSLLSMLFNNDGTALYVMGISGKDINEYTLTTPYDISTGTFNQIALDVSSQENYPASMIFNNDGSKLYVMGYDGGDINEYRLTAIDTTSEIPATTTGQQTTSDEKPGFLAGGHGRYVEDFTTTTKKDGATTASWTGDGDAEMETT